MEFRVLGPFEVVAGGGALALGGAQQRAVLALLLAATPEPVSRDRLVDELWGERAPASAEHAMQVYVSEIRKVLRISDGEAAVRTFSSGYALEVDAERVDVRRFERFIEDAQRVLGEDPAGARELFELALGLWRGPPLVEFERFEWARREADRLEDVRAEALEGLAEARLACGEHGEVIATLTGLVAANPLRERPRRLLMLALYRCGRHAEALAAYRDACAALDEIGLQPGPELRQLEQAILRHDPSLRHPNHAVAETDGAAPVESRSLPAARRSRLPIAAHTLVGRTSEMSMISALLARSDIRLVTLLGAGGSGKTRLALEVATELVKRYRDGVWFVSLAPLADPRLVDSEIARTIGIAEAEGQPVNVTLAEALSQRELLLVLDNFEHLLAAASLVADLLTVAPGVDVLTTSREPLRIRGERRVDVPPLSLDEAVELFVQRAFEVRHDLKVQQEDGGPIERICARLDQLPLALELAAAWVAVFGPRALDARLADRVNLPEGLRDLPERQRTLEATIDWSYQLLESSDRILLQSLAPFIGGVRADSAEIIWGPEAIHRLLSLAEKSLLRRREDADAEPRFWMLETIREFALQRAMAEGRADEAKQRHAEYFLALTEEAAPHLRGREQHRWLERLEHDHANLRAALDHLTYHAPAEAIHVAANLEWFWIIRGPVVEGRSHLTAALASAPAGSPRRSEALAAAGQILMQLGETAEAEPLLLEALALARTERKARVAVLTLSHLGWAAEASGDHTGSTARHQQAIATARAANDDWPLGIALNNYAIMTARRGDLEQARTLLEESLLLGRGLGDTRAVALTANNLAETALILGDLDHAEALINESLAAAREIEFRSIIATALGTQAEITLERGDLESASEQVREAADLTRSTYTIESAPALLSLAGTIAAIRHEPTRAAKLWAAADSARARIGLAETSAVNNLRAQWYPKARAAAPDGASWDAAWAAGAEIPLDEALAMAAEEH